MWSRAVMWNINTLGFILVLGPAILMASGKFSLPSGLSFPHM